MVDLSLQAVCGVTTVSSWPLGEQLLHPYPLHLVTWCVGGGKCEDCISCNVDKFNTDVSAWEDSIHRINISTWCCSAVSISDLSKDHGCMG